MHPERCSRAYFPLHSLGAPSLCVTDDTPSVHRSWIHGFNRTRSRIACQHMVRDTKRPMSRESAVSLPKLGPSLESGLPRP